MLLANIWTLPPWQVILAGGCAWLAVLIQQALYPRPPSRAVAVALSLSHWLLILVGGCVVALGILRLLIGS